MRLWVKKLKAAVTGESLVVGTHSSPIIERYASDPEFPFLVSFPRTGSHWLRCLMELYFGRPTLVRVFYHPLRSDYMLLHVHDLDLDVYRRNVIYLYRDPVPAVFSLMMYHKEDPDDEGRIRHWANLYGHHLKKWLLEETVSRKKTILRYENLQQDICDEFAKVTAHYGESLDADRLRRAAERVSRREVSTRTQDAMVINLQSSYDELRRKFIARHGSRVWENVLLAGGRLESFFDSGMQMKGKQ